MSMEKIKRFMANHKKELIATTVVVGGAVLVILGFKHSAKKPVTKMRSRSRVRDIPIPDSFKVWNTTELWLENGRLDAIIGSIPLDDLGELGNQYVKEGLADPGDIATIIIGVKSKK